MKKILLVLYLLISIQCIYAQDATAYYLPKTKFKFVLTVERKFYRPGDYAAYAAKYLKINNIAPKGYDVQRILNMRIEQVGVPDESRMFHSKNVGKLTLSDDGCLLAVNAVPPPTPKGRVYRETDVEKLYKDGLPFTAEMQQAASKAKVAQLIANEIYDIRQTKDDLVKVRTDKATLDSLDLRTVLERLDGLENSYRKYFEGVSVVDTLEQVYEVIPDNEITNQQLFSFNGVPYYITITNTHQSAKHLDQPEQKAKDETGIWTNVPGIAHISIFQNEQLWTEYNFYVAQFGSIQNIGSTIISKKLRTKLILHPATGGIKNIEMTEN